MVVDPRALAYPQALRTGTLAEAQRSRERSTGLMAATTNGDVVCLQNDGYAVSQEGRKLYRVIRDAYAEANHLIRVVDESCEDYLYPARLFRRLDLPASVRRALRLVS